MFVADTNNRTLLYSIKAGSQDGSFIGHPAAISANGDRVLIQSEDGVADLCETATLRSLAHYDFPARIVDADFMTDGSLLVLTADQNVFQLKPPSGQQRASQ
jgi:hypothetical protein